VFLRGKLNPAIATKISLFQRIGHRQCPKSLQFFHNSSDICSCNFSRKSANEESAGIRGKTIVRGLGDIKTAVDVDFNGLVADEAVGV
jgi:hypothetical protein